ncbi:uncharacterized protein [Panulirus ornatus]|uniref:uncharacterized protein n=1 Tax=Panulirus ornatus TaxID=150431 RepID=UPI003A8586CE
MNALTVLCFAAVAACSSAQLPLYPGLYPGLPLMKALAEEPVKLEAKAPIPLAYNMAPFSSIAPIHSQYNSQDEFGQYAFGYNGGFNNRAEIRDAFGNVRGSYNYLDADGKVQTQHYVADALGYRVQGTNLPEATAPEFLDYAEDVAAARAEHLAVHEAAAAPAAAPEPKYIDYTEEVAAARADHMAAHAAKPEPKYIDYTEEVAAARADHQAAHDEATAAEAPAARKRRSVIVSDPSSFLRFPYGFSAPFNFAHPTMMGSALPYTAGLPTYAGLPALTYSSAAPAAPLDAELLRIENNPKHAVSYRVD